MTRREHFIARIHKTPTCWLWTAGCNGDGYGKLKVHGQSVGAHRVSWELYRGDIPHGLSVLHRCDNPPCVNPDHLFLGTHVDNIRDAAQKGRMTRGERHHKCTLTEADVRIILGIPEGTRGVAKRFGVSRRTIQNIRIRHTWKHIFPLPSVEIVQRGGVEAGEVAPV